MRKIYVASSWRNPYQQNLVTLLRKEGHEVYDFRNPDMDNHGFHWSEIDGGWKMWTNERYRLESVFSNRMAQNVSDFDAMKWADTFVLALPCGRSAHLEFGWACGQGKTTVIWMSPEQQEPELMNKMADFIAINNDELLDFLSLATP